jgi:O-antigen/teichoic acid export membrane protein
LTATRKIAKNTVLLTLGLMSGRFLSLLVLEKMTPLLGTEGIGIWGFATDITTILLVVSRFGLDTLLTREVTRSKARTLPLLWAALRIRLGMGAICYIFLLIFSSGPGFTELKTTVVLLTGLAIFIEASAMACDSVFQAHEKVEYQSLGQLVSAVSYFGIAWWALEAGHGLLGVVWANLISRILRLLVMAPLMFLKTGPWRWRDPEAEEKLGPAPGVWALTRMGWPVFLSTTFGIVYNKVDTVMLSTMLGDAVTGIYVLGHRALDVMLILPNLFGTALFPTMARYSFESSEDARRLGERSLRFLLAAMVPFTLFLTLTAGPIIGIFSDGDAGFADSAHVMMIVIWGLPLQAANIIFNRLLMAAELERTFKWIALYSMLANVVLNVFLIPRYSYYGASIATILALTISFLMHLHYLRGTGYMPSLVKPVLGPVAGTIGGWALVVGLCRVVLPQWQVSWLSMPLDRGWGPFLVVTLLAGAAYLGALVLMRVVKKDDLALLAQILKR